MFGLFYLAWLALAIVLFVFIVRNLLRCYREPALRKRASSRMALQIVALAALTWPFLLGRGVYELNCRYRSGLSVEETIDLNAGGYLVAPDGFDDKKKLGGPLSPASSYDRQAVQDLLMGRISFFEKPIRQMTGASSGYDIRYERYFLDDPRKLRCVSSRTEEEMVGRLPLPAGRCLARTQSWDSRALYRLRGDFVEVRMYGANRANYQRWFEDAAGDALAKYRMFSHWTGLIADAGSLVLTCPTDRGSADQAPFRGLTAFVLRDRNGEVASMDLVRKWEAAHPEGIIGNIGEFPPRYATDQAHPGTERGCEALPVPDDVEIHKIRSEGGFNPMPIRLDTAEDAVGQEEIVVNLPAHPVVLLLEAKGPVVWHISRTADSRIAAVIATGRGQAVLGLDRSVPLYLSPDYYSPARNCSSFELSDVHRAVVGSRHLQRELYLNHSSENRFALVGHTLPGRSELLYSRDRALSEFTLDARPAIAPLSSRREPLRYSPDPLE